MYTSLGKIWVDTVTQRFIHKILITGAYDLNGGMCFENNLGTVIEWKMDTWVSMKVHACVMKKNVTIRSIVHVGLSGVAAHNGNIVGYI